MILEDFKMAKVRNNVVVRGLSGSFGDQMVIKIDKAGRTIVANKPEFDPNRQFTDQQINQQDAFHEAVNYAKSAKGQAEYIAKAEGTPKSAYNVAMADWFHAPEIKDIDLSGRFMFNKTSLLNSLGSILTIICIIDTNDSKDKLST
jgi:hypothetical protein